MKRFTPALAALACVLAFAAPARAQVVLAEVPLSAQRRLELRGAPARNPQLRRHLGHDLYRQRVLVGVHDRA